MTKNYCIPTQFGRLYLTVSDGSGRLTSSLQRENCPTCDRPDCGFVTACCEDDDVIVRAEINGMLDAVESMVLSHAVAGIDVESEPYVKGVISALDAIGNRA